MSETTPQAQTGASQMPQQTRGQERVTPQQAPAPQRSEARAPEPTGWTGWVFFASMMMIMIGAFQAIMGLTALFDDGWYITTSNGLVVNFDYTAWGWTHLVLGAVAVAAGFGLLAGQMWARIVGVAMALVSAVVNLAFMAAYPFWSLIVITLDVVVIYAIAMHGKEMKDATA